MPINNSLTPAGQNELGAAFGLYPSMGKRRVQDPVGATDMPLQFLRGRVAATAGMPSDVLNTVRSPMPMEMFGDVDYSQQKLLPYGTSQLLKELPLAPTSRAGEVAGEIGSVAPMTPAEALQAARLARQTALAGGRVVGGAINEAMVYGRGPLASITPQPMFAVPQSSGKGFNIAKRDASDIFGVGSERVKYTEPTSGGVIEILAKPDGSASVLNLEVPEKFRGKGIGESLQSQVLQDFPEMMGQVSSKAAAKTAYRLGRRPPSMPNATLDEVYKLMDENSSVNLVSPQMQKRFMPEEVGNGLRESRKNAPTALPQENALKLAKERAATLGQSENPATRMLQQGYEDDWYHGSTGDITRFREDLLGEATGAASAKKGFFFARDPQNPPTSLMQKTNDPESIDLLRRLGKTEEEIAALNSVSMKGHGAETASGYAQIGGSREYREATRKAKAAEKRGDWDEYEKQAQIAEDSEINRMNYAQSLTAKYGDARDTMTEKVNQTFYSLQHPQEKADLLDKKYKELMPYGWYNTYTNKQFDNLKDEITKLVGKDAAGPALKEIDNFKSIKNERTLIDKSQEGGNVMPVALRYKNPLVHDFGGSSYREQTYSDLIDKALAGGHDALILKNTYDPGAGASKLVDVGVVFSPDQIRSRFAAFDPLRKTAATAAAAGLAAPDLLAQDKNQLRKNR